MLSTAKSADIHTSQKRDNANIGPFDHIHAYYQTFTSTTSYLSTIEFTLTSLGYPHDLDFNVEIQLADGNGNKIASEQYKIPKSTQIYDLRFTFTPQRDSLNKHYRLYFQTDAPPRTVFLVGSDYDSYTQGDLVASDGRSTHVDLAFFTYNKPEPFALLEQTFQKSGERFLSMLLITITFLGFGYMLTSLFLNYQDPVELVISTLLIGIAVPPILFFILSLFRIRLEKDLLAAILSGLVVVTASGMFFFSKRKRGKMSVRLEGKEVIILSLMFTISLITRLIQINDLIVPSGIGAQFHQNVLEKISSKEEIPLDSIYHLGFHSNVFLVHLLTNSTLPEATLVYGQWLSVISGLSFYLLARRFFGDPMYALITTSLYWFISPIPAYFLNISRYPFLQGLTLLPGVIALIWDNEKRQAKNEPIIIVAMIGLLLSHYGAMIILAVILFGFIVYKSVKRNFLTWETGRILKFGTLFSILGLVALLKIYYVSDQGAWGSFLRSPSVIVTPEDYRYFFSHTLRHGGVILWLIGILGGIIYFARRINLFLLAMLCMLALFGVDWLQMNLLGHSASRPTNILFALSIPMSIFAGYAAKYFVKNYTSLGILLLIVISLTGGYNISGIVNPRNVFYSLADQESMDWIKSNTASNSIILIDSYLWDGKYDPTDGGYWITFLTGRKTVSPNTDSEYNEIENFIDGSNANYAYVGSGYGNLTPLVMNKLNQSLLYKKNGIYIYEIHK